MSFRFNPFFKRRRRKLVKPIRGNPFDNIPTNIPYSSLALSYRYGNKYSSGAIKDVVKAFVHALNNLDNIYNSIDKCKDFVGESIPVTLNNGKLVGIITEGDLFQIFLKVSSEEKELENRD